MNLPKDAEEIANRFTELSPERKQQILEHLRLSGGDRAQATVSQIIKNGGPEGKLVEAIFGKDLPDPGAAPENKKMNPPNVKTTVTPRLDPNHPEAGTPQPFGNPPGTKHTGRND
jgi:hypothetical protein